MSLDSCRPLSPLSLSLTSLLSRPVFIQGSGVESPGPHSHWRGGRGFNGPTRMGEGDEGRPLQEGGVVPLFSGVGFFLQPVYPIFRRSFREAGGRRHGARSVFWLAGTVSEPYPPGFVRTTERLQGFGRSSGGLSDAAHFSARTSYVP